MPHLKEVLPILINQMLRHYEEEVKDNPENAFEHNLEWANRLINQMLKPNELNELNFIFGGIKNNQLQFAYNGKINGYIIFKEGEKYRHLDLIKTYGDKQKETGPFFSNLISGDLSPDNLVIFCTAPVFDFLTIDRLEKIILSRPMEDACRYLEKTLNQIENQLSFGGLIINLLTPTAQRQIQIASSVKITPDNSIRRLVRKERETENILSPSLLAVFKNFFEKFEKKKVPNNETETEPTVQPRSDLETIKKIAKIYNRITGWQGQVKKTWRTTIKFFSRPARPTEDAPVEKIIASKKSAKTTHSKIQYKIELRQKLINLWQVGVVTIKMLIQKLWQMARARLLALPPTRRYLFLGAVIIGTIFVVSVGLTYQQNSNRLEQEKYNQLLNSIKEKIDQADSSIIYKNEEQAKKLLTEIKNDLAGFPRDTANRREIRNNLLANADTIAAKLRHLETVVPTLAADLTVLNLACQPTDLISTKLSFFFFCKNDENFWQYDIKNKTTVGLTSPILGELKNKFVKKDGAILLLNGQNRLTQFDPTTGSFSSLEVTWPKTDSEIKLIGHYNTYLYSLDTKNNLITKHKESTTGFTKGSAWLKENGSVSDITAWTIDGSIYTAKPNGTINKFDGGQLQNFSLIALDPQLNSAVKIFSSPDSTNLFILDPGQKRMIIWNKKTQKLIAQYTAEEFIDLKDFSIDEKNKTIYLLNGMKIQNIKY
ncbi:MAG: hypothetical protein UU49_C0005G0053 [Candidatus Magasanikbacteria bacterium GW2011_GWC2_41_17]|uniref:Uncharacterized protein n=2 Tax=Candidatus Magasanikiibacteriota TaxID=1752731 RepID=A0A0G0WL91_9BACT|nr:MAG: hypothetical protein UU49_C0005G0053 [Candidatus Magasanikbacteria bacterium GW2011_GWC2_41_17]KKS13579.1 MAG: hypothetical protein UU69_C0002G0014 [Candidatus Magasanikbacteria bacterium GW2011_GWA2_41_55]